MDISIVILGITVSAALILVAVLIIKFIRKKEEIGTENETDFLSCGKFRPSA